MNPIHIAAKKLMAANILVFITISRGRELKSACRRAGGEVIGGEVEPATSNNSDDIFMVLPATSLSWRVDMDKAMIALVGRTTPPKLPLGGMQVCLTLVAPGTLARASSLSNLQTIPTDSVRKGDETHGRGACTPCDETRPSPKPFEQVSLAREKGS